MRMEVVVEVVLHMTVVEAAGLLAAKAANLIEGGNGGRGGGAKLKVAAEVRADEATELTDMAAPVAAEATLYF